MRRVLCCALLLVVGCSREREPVVIPPPPLHFEDATSQSGVTMDITSGKTPSTQILEVKGGGLALLDVDQDGDPDLLVPNGATLDAPAEGPGGRLFENMGGMRFRDVTESSGVRLRRWGFGPAVGDVDGDGRDDVFVACFGRNVLLRNLGDGRFEDVTEAAGLAEGRAWSAASAFGDLDGDGDLDLYVVNYLRFDPASPPPPTTFLGVEVFAGPHGLPPERDRVFENRGDGTFHDVTDAWGFGAPDPAFGLGAVILDLDLDGAQEVFVGNDSRPNFLFRRRPDGTFEDVGVEAGIALNGAGAAQATMGIAVGDVDGNGLPDVFTTNFMNDTNTLHLNLGDLRFADGTTRWGLGAESRPFIGWAAAFFDFDHDADEDLMVFNGHVYPTQVTGPHDWKHDQEPLLFERRRRRFEPVAAERGGAWLSEARCARSASFGDLDGDGDVDMVVGELNGPVRILENDGAGKGHWLRVRLDDRRPGTMNPRGLGSRVDVQAGDQRHRRWIHAGGSYQAASIPEAHVGLGRFQEGPVTVTVTWPDGTAEVQERVAVDRLLTIERR